MASPLTSVNYWPNNSCARAFWNQHELPPYRELLADTVAWLRPGPGERWLDLGCGCGRLSEAVWRESEGRVAEVVGLDCAELNARAYEQLRASLVPAPGEALKFVAADFSTGLAGWDDGHFDGVVSGLAMQYAESYSAEEGRWTSEGYDRLLREVSRVLQPGGWFVFSVNVPKPAWGWVALSSLAGLLRTNRPLRSLRKAYRIWRYGGWLRREAARGRFHYLPIEDIMARLTAAGFSGIEYRRSFARQAYVVRCFKNLDLPAGRQADANAADRYAVWAARTEHTGRTEPVIRLPE